VRRVLLEQLQVQPLADAPGTANGTDCREDARLALRLEPKYGVDQAGHIV
jgi:hypothetical protein